MNKIIEAINSMIESKEQISDVKKSGPEYFFVFNDEYKWSIRRSDNEIFFLYYYPSTNLSIEDLAGIENEFSNWTGIDMVTFSTKEHKTREAIESFSELYGIVKNKIYNIDSVLDDIIDSSKKN